MTKNDTQRFECFIWALATLTEGLSLEDLMPNMSHPASWVGSYQKSSVFPGCLGLDLMFPGSCFVCRAMLVAEKQHLEHGLDMWVSNSGGRPECVCLLVTTQAINVCMASGHFSSTSLWGCTLQCPTSERERQKTWAGRMPSSCLSTVVYSLYVFCRLKTNRGWMNIRQICTVSAAD